MRLSAEQFAALSPLLDEGLGLAEGARAMWLDGMTEPFPGAKSLLAKMLAQEASGAAEGLLHMLPKLSSATGGAGPDRESAFRSETRIGNYRLVRELGSGGMGQVWLAMRIDELVTRPVALKLPHLHLQSAMLANRFARERDILANLTHPNIAHLYDAGISTQGQPYLVMEFVAGESLTQYCQACQATVRERLELFLQVLSAVQYAHTQNIIHRDLKPSNILVRESAQVVLLDFGIAKLLTEGQADATELTRHGGVAFTPDYASPEQIKGETLGPATDIYSLGVVLFELLTCQRPYELCRSTRRELEEAILSTHPPRPSDSVTGSTVSAAPNGPPQIQRKDLRGDLDNIVLKALKKQAKDRYPTAEAFAEDLRRHLRHDAVSARPDTLWYRSTRLAQRHRSVLASAAVAAALSAVVGLLAISRGFISMQRAVADNQVNFSPPLRSIAVLPFVNMDGDANEEYFSDGISDELLNALTRFNELRVAARTSSFSFKGKNVDVSTIAHKLNVGAILEGSVRRAGDNVRISAELINTVTGFHIWSQTYDRNLTDILNVHTDVATAVAQQLRVSLAGDEAARLELGDTKNPQAYEAYLRGAELLSNWDLGEAGLRAALAPLDQAIALDPNYALAYVKRAEALTDISVFVDLKSDERIRIRKQAVQAAERAVAIAAELGEAHLALAKVRSTGLLDFGGAATEFDRALALAPGSARVQRSFAAFAGQLGHFEPAIISARRAVSLDPQNVDAHVILGDVLVWARRYAAALTALRAAQVLRPNSLYVTFHIANALLASGAFEAVRQLCESGAIPAQNPARHFVLAIAYRGLGRKQDSERELGQFKVDSGNRASLEMAVLYAQLENKAAALETLTKAEQQRDPGFQVLRVSWGLDPIRSEPEFKAIEARMDFPP